MATSQVNILTLVSRETLKDFPANLPHELREPLQQAMLELSTALKEAAIAVKEGKSFKREVRRPTDDTTAELFISVINLYASQVSTNDSEGLNERFERGFERLLSSQGIIMTFAYLEAFMSDTIRSICTVRPDVLKSEKKIEWSTALTFDKKDDLIRYLIERYVFEFGWLTLSKRIEHLRKEVGIQLVIQEDEINLLQMAENIRHVAIHNGGKVSPEFIERTARNDLIVGDLVPITLEDVAEISQAAILLASDLFRAVAKKFYDIQESDLTGVLRRGKPSPKVTRKGKSKESLLVKPTKAKSSRAKGHRKPLSKKS